MKKIIWIVGLLALLLGCSEKDSARNSSGSGRTSMQSLSAENSDDTTIIGFSIATDTFIIERWNKDIKVFSGAVRELGAEVIVQLSAGGTAEQIARIDFMIKENIDVLVVIAHDTEMLAGSVKQANDAGIPVIAYDRLILGVPIDAYISFDNIEVGRLFGETLLEEVPAGRYLIVNGSLRDNNSFMVHDGLMEILEPSLAEGKISLVDDIWLEEWSFDEALEKIGEVLALDDQIDAISCGNDQIANAAVQLLAERRQAGEVAVVGQDADLVACQRIVEGTQLMTVYKPIGTMAAQAAELAIAVARGEMPEPDTYMDNHSGESIPSFIQMPVPIFKENMDEIIVRDGFHSAEDIYRNVLPVAQN